MALEYKIVYTGGEAEIVEKKSRFIATVSPVKTEEEALAFIEATKKIMNDRNGSEKGEKRCLRYSSCGTRIPANSRRIEA